MLIVMKEKILLFIGLLLLSCNQDTLISVSEVNVKKNNNDFSDLVRKWWIEYSVIDSLCFTILKNDKNFTDLCDDMELIWCDSIWKNMEYDSLKNNYSKKYNKLLEYGEEMGISNILRYKEEYCKETDSLQTKSIVIIGECELKDIWKATQIVCSTAYEAGYSRYVKMLGCCERRFRSSVEQSYVYLPDANIYMMELYHEVMWNNSDGWDCPMFVNVMDCIGIEPHERARTLRDLSNRITFITNKVAMTPDFWVSCTCKNEASNDDIYKSDHEDPWAAYNNEEVKPQEVDCSDQANRNKQMVRYFFRKFADNGLLWFLDEYKAASVEYSLSLNRNMITGSFIRTALSTDNDPQHVKFRYRMDTIRTVATLHNHPTGNPHSMTDVLSLAKYNIRTQRSLETSLVCTSDGSVYVLYVEDPDKVEAFYRIYENQKASLDLRYSENVKKINKQIREDMEFCDISMYALTAVLDDTDSGIRMIKYDGKDFKQKNAHDDGLIISMKTCK